MVAVIQREYAITNGKNGDDICFCPLDTWIARSACVIAHGQDHSLLRL